VSCTESTRLFLEDESEDNHQDRLDEVKDLMNQYRRVKAEETVTNVKDEYDSEGDVDAFRAV
jgi:hypothetical protein